MRVCGTYSATVLVILRPNVVQSKMTPSLRVPEGWWTTTSVALEYQVGQAAAAVSLAQMVSAGASMMMMLCANRSARPDGRRIADDAREAPAFQWRRH
jgi:hypothetical protein